MAGRGTYRLVSKKDGRTILEHLRVADRFWTRFVGLQFHRPLQSDTGLLVVPCPAIHTFCVRFPLDLIWIDRKGRVTGVRRNVRPWRTAKGPARTCAVIETVCGAATVEPDEELAIEVVSGPAELPRSIAFLKR